MAATLENISQLERRINISLPSQEIDSEVQTRLKQLARNVKMHGFRPGKVPLKVVAQQYQDQVRREVLGDALQKSFGDAVRAQNLKVAGYPRFEPKGELGSVAQVEFSATFEVYPEVTASDMSKVVIKRPSADVNEAEIDKTLEIMRKQRAKFEPVTRPAALGDKVVIDFAGKNGGQEF
jgi:trigger factor